MATSQRHTPSAYLAGLCALACLLLIALLPVAASARRAPHSARCTHVHGRKKCVSHKRRSKRHSGRPSSRSKGVGGTRLKDSNTISQSAVPAAPAGSQTSCPDATLIPDSTNLDRINTSVLCLINEQRAKNGLGALIGNRVLGQVAAAHDLDMVTRNYFDHVDPDGVGAITRILSAGYVPAGYGYDVGENLGWGTQGLAAPINIVANWMNSPEHRANILDPKYKYTGISVIASVPAIEGSGPGAIYTQEFGDLVSP